MNKSLKELAQISYGKDYKSNPLGDKYPIYGTGGVMGYTSKALNFGPAVLSGRKGSINNPIYVEGGFWNVDTIYCLKPLTDTDPKWLFYNLLNTDLSRLNEATGVPSVSTQALNRLEFKYFKGTKQRKIAKILNTVDAVIEKTEAAIAKYKAVKQGMMQDLFTRGIDPQTGKLRPGQKDAPELYKETELGWIPREWEKGRLGNYIKKNIYGPRFNAKDYSENGNVRTIRGTDFTKEGNILYHQCPIADLPIDLVQTHSLKHNDVIIVTTADCGLTAVFEEQNWHYIPSAYTVKYRFDSTVNPFFVKYFMATSEAKKQVEKYIRKGTIANLPGSDLFRFPFSRPSMIEQETIVSRIKGIEGLIENEQTNLSKHQSLKKGLMQDLLTGKVEVEV